MFPYGRCVEVNLVAHSFMFLIPTIHSEKVKDVADKLDDSFVLDRDQLLAALSAIGVGNIEDLIIKLSRFFSEQVDLDNINIDTIQKLDLRKMCYQFVKELGIKKGDLGDAAQKKQMIGAYMKLGRLYIHEIIFPELIETNTNLAFSLLNLLKRTTRAIALSENVSQEAAVAMLQLNEIDIPLHKQLTGSPDGYHLTKECFITLGNAEIRDMELIARILHQDYDAIVKKNAFVSLVSSNGYEIDLMEIRSSKVKLIVHLLYRMSAPYHKEQKPLIKMNKGKGFWKFLQENLIDESGNTIPRLLRKISSEVNSESGHNQIMEDVKNILTPVYNKHNHFKI
jgi:hypothetical protein